MTAAPAAPPVIPGYEHVGLLAQGGMSEVHRYDQLVPRRPVAIKVMKAAPSEVSVVTAFAAEADTLAAIAGHPSVVAIYAAGRATDGRAYLAMRFLPGPDLGTLVRTGGPLDLATTLRVGIQIASAVETLHRAGIVHGDVKPSNIMLDDFGRPTLIDFGNATRYGHRDNLDTGVSVPWAAPELLSGASSPSIATDVYSVGATLHTLLSGHPPFADPAGDGSVTQQVRRVLGDVPRAIGRPDVPVEVEQALRTAMSRVPAQRPASALALARVLQVAESELRLPLTVIEVLETTEPPERAPHRIAADHPDDSGLGATIDRPPVVEEPADEQTIRRDTLAPPEG